MISPVARHRFVPYQKLKEMNRHYFYVLAALICTAGCTNQDEGITAMSESEAALVDARAGGCTPFPRGIVKAPARLCEVEILESNSDLINHIWLVSPAEMFIGTDDDWGSVVALPEVSPNDELIFEIRVHDPSDVATGDSWQTGPASRNADGAIHALVDKCPGRVYHVSFEDIAAGGWGGDEPNYIDAVFVVRPF
jgi:hypothetical protein